MSETGTGVCDLCANLGITLIGEDWIPYHCGSRMRVKSGFCGPDYAECRSCGLIIGDLASPHINRGHIMSDEWFDKHGDRTWVVLREGAPTRKTETMHDRAMNLMSDKPLRKCADGLWRRHSSGRSGGIPGYVMMDLFYRWMVRFERRESGLVAVLR